MHRVLTIRCMHAHPDTYASDPRNIVATAQQCDMAKCNAEIAVRKPMHTLT